MKTLFKYSSKDFFLTAQTLLAIAVAYTMALSDLGIWWNLLIAPFHIFLILSIQNTSLHHHTHWATFNNKLFNKIYELLIAAAAGSKPQTYRLVHTIHHKYVNDPPVNGVCQDPLSVYQLDPEKGELNNFWVYCFKGAWLFNFKAIFVWRPIYKQTQIELWALRAYLAALVLLNPFYGLWYLVVVYLAFVVNNANSYGEHWGALVRRGDTTQDSIGIYSKWYNIFGFNAGLHQEHHHKPGVHWSNLPKVTAELHPNRVIKKHGVHITNNPFWEHFVLLLKKQPAIPK